MSAESIRVLLVEDDDDDVFLARTLLQEVFGAECAVSHVASVEAAVKQVRVCPLDLILLDLTLPDSRGWETVWRVHEAAPDVALVVLTGRTDDSRGVEAIRQGAQDYLIKGHVDAASMERSVRYAIERKRTERELKRYQEQLQDLVDEATRDLLTANEQLLREVRERKAAELQLREALTRLEEHSEAKTRFVSNVSHELKTPLASLSHAVENMKAGVVGTVPDRVRLYLDMMEEDCRRLRTTVNDILDLSRLEANRLVLSRVKLNIARFVEQAANSLRIQAEEKGQTLLVQVERKPMFTLCDPPKMERVVLNVVANAIKFTQSGGRIVIAVRADGHDDGGAPFVCVDCVDNGVGIPPEHLPHIAQRFYRVGEHVAGTGLGLSLSKDVVELHGGTMQIVSPPPGQARGTQVRVRMRCESPPTVLTVDDHEAVRAVLRAQLSAAGYEVLEAPTGEHALELLLATLRPDLLIVDMFLPGIQGLDLIARIKTVAELRYLPIVVITGRELDAVSGSRLREFGVPALAKPWKWNELIEQLEDVTLAKHYLKF